MSFDFVDIFKEQLAVEKPFTAGNVRQVISLKSFNMTARQLMEESRYLKTKIGLRRLVYTILDEKGHPKLEKVWEDELDQLQGKLSRYSLVTYNGIIPVFELQTGI